MTLIRGMPYQRRSPGGRRKKITWLVDVISDVDSDVSDIEEEEKSKEEPRSQDWALQVEKEEKDLLKAIERGRRKVVITREWQELMAWREGWVCGDLPAQSDLD